MPYLIAGFIVLFLGVTFIIQLGRYKYPNGWGWLVVGSSFISAALTLFIVALIEK